jgi:hypothetical protein
MTEPPIDNPGRGFASMTYVGIFELRPPPSQDEILSMLLMA